LCKTGQLHVAAFVVWIVLAGDLETTVWHVSLVLFVFFHAVVILTAFPVLPAGVFPEPGKLTFLHDKTKTIRISPVLRPAPAPKATRTTV
jgi:hypothetical protein